MADDPFAKYGGAAVEEPAHDDPFAKYGGSVLKAEQPGAIRRFIGGTPLDAPISNFEAGLDSARKGDALGVAKALVRTPTSILGVPSLLDTPDMVRNIVSHAKKAWNAPDAATATREGVYAIPGVGPMVEQPVENYRTGNYAGLGGNLATIMAMMGGPAAMRAAPFVRAGASGAIEGAMRPAAMGMPASLHGALLGAAADIPGANYLGIPHGAGPIIGAVAPMVRGARASIADLMKARAPVPEVPPPVEPVTESPAGGWAWPGQQNSGPVTISDLMKAQSANPRGVDVRSMAEYSPEDLASAARSIMQRNRTPTASELNGGPAPADLSAQLDSILARLRAGDPPEPAAVPEPTTEELLQRSIDAAKAKKGKK